jgi:hypothetical protein
MESFADNREFWKKAGVRARKKVVTKYDLSDVVDRYVSIVGTLVNH